MMSKTLAIFAQSRLLHARAFPETVIRWGNRATSLIIFRDPMPGDCRTTGPGRPVVCQREAKGLRAFAQSRLSVGLGMSYARYTSVQTQSECIDNLQDGRKFRVSLTGQGFVKSLTGQSGISRQLCHAAGAGTVAQRFV